MKKPQPDQLHIDHIRLSSTQADGDSHSSLRQPDADDQLPNSVSEYDLHVYDKQQQQQQQQQNQEKDIGHDQQPPVSESSKRSAKNHGGHLFGHLPWGTRASMPAVSRNDSSNSNSNSNNSAGGNDINSNSKTRTGGYLSTETLGGLGLSSPVSSASKSGATDTVENARPGPVLEACGASPPPQNPLILRGLTEKEAAVEGHTAATPDTLDYQGAQVDDHSGGVISSSGENGDNGEDGKGGVAARVATLARSLVATTKEILLYSWLNALLIFVPIGIIVACIPAASPAVVFSMNAIAIVPLAGLLAIATESVARRMGDSIGALLNVTFGNAVELIILIALVKNEIRIVQASLLGSILSNLLLILGMGFLLGGLRFREQIYNSTVTQMSACLLSLSVISLVLPTAFHAAFSDSVKADRESLKISRGTSVILLLVYGMYLLFQLKSHAYMYESTPQYIIDEESTPGPAAAWLESSSSDDSSSSSSDSDSSGHSRSTMKKRMRRVIRGGRRRKSSVASMDTADGIFGEPMRTPSFGTGTVTATAGNDGSRIDEVPVPPASVPHLAALDINEDVIEEDDTTNRQQKKHRLRRSLRRHHRKNKKLNRMESSDQDAVFEDTGPEVFQQGNWNNESNNAGGIALVALKGSVSTAVPVPVQGETRRVDFAFAGPDRTGLMETDGTENTAASSELVSSLRALNLRAMSLRPVAKSLAPPVFTQAADSTATPTVPSGPIPRVRYGIRRTNSLPDRLNHMQFRAPGAMLPSHIPASRIAALSSENRDGANHTNEEGLMLSQRAAVLMLLVSTALVAVCAEFMVDSINGLVETSSVGEVFIGLIILPIVGNAAEHVTSVKVAIKNKLDLAIGVAVGSSIQIALFTTPLVVILGWIMGRDMTLYFTLFETVCLFVSAFIVNFLVLDGRSNYLEGALLCATYVIISLVAFYYPDSKETSAWGR